MTAAEPLALSHLPRASCRGVRGIFCDIDDTLTWHGRLVPSAFAALARAHQAGLRVVPVTGRPAGWVDHIARMWPVDGCVGENGGLWFSMEGGVLVRRFLQPPSEREANRERLRALGEQILQRVPGTALASDQPYRELDLAIDFCEDVPALDDAAIDAIVALFHEAGATCKVSSIHVNGWFGFFDKLEGCRRFVRDRYQEDLDGDLSGWIYVGDSANDEPMFRAFPLSIGVANVRRFLPRMLHGPTYITAEPGGAGFAQVIDHLLTSRDPAET
ncbi:MAG: HAD-IIB family hydrolase [Deltaproteobacteria bacterium]|nr:MAG: HAD-IIB family hydrolase [Deltaproteobacteria bacterium]